jgi:hypothetical protein
MSLLSKLPQNRTHELKIRILAVDSSQAASYTNKQETLLEVSNNAEASAQQLMGVCFSKSYGGDDSLLLPDSMPSSLHHVADQVIPPQEPEQTPASPVQVRWQFFLTQTDRQR